LSTLTRDDYLHLVGEKVNQARDKLLIPGYRNSDGLGFTIDRIRKSAENFYFSTSDISDPVLGFFTNFSKSPGLSDVTETRGVDVVDISIASAIESVIPYICLERGMSQPEEILFFQRLISENAAGGFAKGATVRDPYTPSPNTMNLQPDSAVVSSAHTVVAGALSPAIDLSSPIRKGSVKVVIATGNVDNAEGIDALKDGTIYFSDSGNASGGSIDYDSGVVTITGATAADIITVTAERERSAESDGANTLKLVARNINIRVVAEPNRIILNNSLENQAYMRKMVYDNKAMGVDYDWAQASIVQLLKAYTDFLNLRVVNQLWSTVNKTEVGIGTRPSLAYNTYSIGTSDAGAKNDLVHQFIINLNTRLLQKCDKRPNCYTVDVEAYKVLANNPNKFTPVDVSVDEQLDGYVGTYDGTPVIRHSTLNSSGNAGRINANHGVVVASYKSPDGRTGPIAFGEYLPPYSNKPAFNYDNPAQFSQGLFSHNVAVEVSENLCTYGNIQVA
jgi:hypothetical protein